MAVPSKLVIITIELDGDLFNLKILDWGLCYFKINSTVFSCFFALIRTYLLVYCYQENFNILTSKVSDTDDVIDSMTKFIYFGCNVSECLYYAIRV